MKIFIAGAAGFLGSAVTKELAKRGHEIIGLDRTEGAKIPGVRYVKGDLHTPGKWRDEIKGADKVISLINPFDQGEDVRLDSIQDYSNCQTRAVSNLISAAAAGKARQVLITCHTDCYGDRKGKWASDADAIDPVGFCKPIADSVDAAESLAEAYDMKLVRVFPAMVYGNGGWFKRLVEDFKAGRARLVEPGDNYINLLHIDDLAGLYANIVEAVDTSEVFALTDHRPVTQRVFMEHVATLMGLPMPRTLSFDSYAKEFGVLQAESMSASTRVPGLKAIDTLGYSMKVRSYEQGVLITLKSMGEKVGEEFIKAA